MRHKLISTCLIVLALIPPSLAAVDPATGPIYLGHASSEADQWQRIEFSSEKVPLRNASEVKIAIQTKGPPMQGSSGSREAWHRTSTQGKA